MQIEILTLFPGMFPGVFEESILKRAQESGRVSIRVRNIRDYTTDRHRVTDDTPYGGGPGMVMKPEPIAAALEAAQAEFSGDRLRRAYLSPDGRRWSQELAEEYATLPGFALLCGHYEGIDERVRASCIDEEISLGDFVMTGGEIAAMAIVDSVVRLLPGVLGNEESLEKESFGKDGLLDCPHYTRPPEFEGMGIPEVLLSGHHANIERWRREQSLARTLRRRPDLLETHGGRLSSEDLAYLARLKRDFSRADGE